MINYNGWILRIKIGESSLVNIFCYFTFNNKSKHKYVYVNQSPIFSSLQIYLAPSSSRPPRVSDLKILSHPTKLKLTIISLPHVSPPSRPKRSCTFSFLFSDFQTLTINLPTQIKDQTQFPSNHSQKDIPRSIKVFQTRRLFTAKQSEYEPSEESKTGCKWNKSSFSMSCRNV